VVILHWEGSFDKVVMKECLAPYSMLRSSVLALRMRSEDSHLDWGYWDIEKHLYIEKHLLYVCRV
jgi:hypothetical protein